MSYVECVSKVECKKWFGSGPSYLRPVFSSRTRTLNQNAEQLNPTKIKFRRTLECHRTVLRWHIILSLWTLSSRTGAGAGHGQHLCLLPTLVDRLFFNRLMVIFGEVGKRF